MHLKKEIRKVRNWEGPRLSGRVTHVIGLLIESEGPRVALNEICTIYGKSGSKVPCQVVGFKDQKVLLMPFTEVVDIGPGAEVFPTDQRHTVKVTHALLGRVLDALGNPIDDKGPIQADKELETRGGPPDPLARSRIAFPLITGVRAIDGLTTLGEGQRMGIFSGSGVGKSTLLARIARNASADVNVIALIGERGREVREFVERDLGSEGLARSVLVVATAEKPALFRSQGAFVATAIAEYFRDQGKKVMLMMDSISRFAYARREIGLAVGEPPTTRGYTPSVFALLPQLVERAGNGAYGSITALYTILAEGDDLADPIADTMRSLLDGHITLSRHLASKGHFPPIDILQSLSRVQKEVVSKEHMKNTTTFRRHLAIYKEAEDLINLGAYAKGANSQVDEALTKLPHLLAFLQQEEHEHSSFAHTTEALHQIAQKEF